MRLSDLLQGDATLQTDCTIQRLMLDSRKVAPGDLFIAFKGAVSDGRDFIPSAIEKGAAAILLEEEGAPNLPETAIPLIKIPQLQSKLGAIAARFYGFPAEEMPLLGVTGTSGKTSCSQFLSQALTELHLKCGVIGTLGSGFYGALGKAGLTTPDAINLQAMLRDFVDAGAKAVAMEVSSHSIDQGRVNGLPFTLGIFTNLSQDHLDYHHDMATYAAVKQRFFTELPTKLAIINVDDPIGLSWLQPVAKLKPVIAYSIQKTALPANVPAVYTTRAEFTLSGIKAYVVTPWGDGKLQLSLIGRFNLSNALAVLAALGSLNYPLWQILSVLQNLKPVSGRMQIVSGTNEPLVVVDYAHKPDALLQVLKALNAHKKGKLICVFGCGGERDRAKRPLMAQIAEANSDQVIVTNDNPRHEAPEAIVAEIMSGFENPKRVTVEYDRKTAIQLALQSATLDDCVLIAGKGGETYQLIGDESRPFCDVSTAKSILQGNA